jgi:hypothetical protein
MQLDVPDFGSESIDRSRGIIEYYGETDTRDLESVQSILVAHAAFRATMDPEVSINTAFYERCAAEVDAARLLFPGVRSRATLVVFAAWLAFGCEIDDLLESLRPDERRQALLDCLEILQCCPARDGR